MPGPLFGPDPAAKPRRRIWLLFGNGIGLNQISFSGWRLEQLHFNELPLYCCAPSS
jgi:hypothetical protein